MQSKFSTNRTYEQLSTHVHSELFPFERNNKPKVTSASVKMGDDFTPVTHSPRRNNLIS